MTEGATEGTAEGTAGGTAGGTAHRTVTFYDHVGGEETFTRLVSRFYSRVREDPVLRPLYPEEELDSAEERLRLFLMQYWGGPTTYGETRGHPRLRMRHAPFAIGPRERDAWLANMRAAVDSLGLDPQAHTMLWTYLERAAFSLVNRFDDEAALPPLRQG